ncbi:MAG TPA: hypothetical protein VJ808_00145 [Gemmatimonadales bacterium]|nr:hypothetical protein [Gemmatimonadales bacterium]
MTWSWLAFAALGAGHGINPGMGWLFAVALGLQEGRSRAVWRALPPLALGHALAVGVALLAAAAVGQVVPANVLKWMVSGSLLGLGGVRLVRHQHVRSGGMRVGFRGLTSWSFLMATAHGAGLMVLPLLAGDVASTGGTAHAGHPAHAMLMPMSGFTDVSLWSMVFHTGGYLLVTGLVAVIVYHKLGLRFLRTMWINLDLIWGGALILTGALTPLF